MPPKRRDLIEPPAPRQPCKLCGRRTCYGYCESQAAQFVRKVKADSQPPKNPLTRRQAQAMIFIRDFIAREGYSPVEREIAEGTDHGTRSGVHHTLMVLQTRGYIMRNTEDRRLQRTIKLTEKALEYIERWGGQHD